MAYLKELKDVMQSAKILEGTAVSGGRSRDELVACLLAGSSLGLSLSEALNLYVDKFGQVNASAAFMRVLAKRAGWRVEVDVSGEPHRETATVTLTKDGERCSWSVSMDDVARADLLWQERWKKQPKASLVAYATVQAIRVYVPEVLGPLGFAPEEGVEGRPKSFAPSFPQEPRRPGDGARPQAPVVNGEVVAAREVVGGEVAARGVVGGEVAAREVAAREPVAGGVAVRGEIAEEVVVNTNGSQQSRQPLVAEGQGGSAPGGGRSATGGQPPRFNPNRPHPVQRFGNGTGSEQPAPGRERPATGDQPARFNPNRPHPVGRFGNGAGSEQPMSSGERPATGGQSSRFNPNRPHPVRQFGDGTGSEQPAPGGSEPVEAGRDDKPAFRPVGKTFLDRVRASAVRRV
jgi:hypothetical protein